MEQRVGDSGIASARGTKKSLFLNDLKYFHVIDGLPPDIVHDIFEGLAVDVISNMLHVLGKEKCLKLSSPVLTNPTNNSK